MTATLTGKAPTILTEIGARRLTARIRDALAVADDLLAQAYQGRAWDVLGYTDWTAYCEGELPELRHVKLRKDVRRERTRALLEEGATEREIAAATGASPATAHRDVVAVTGREPASNEATQSPEAPAASSVQRAVELVTAQGSRGLTCLELEEESGWRHGAASAALSRAEKRGLVRRMASFRRGYAAYVAAV